MKKLFFFLSFLSFMSCEKCCRDRYCREDKTPIQKYVPYQLVVNFANTPTAAQMADFTDKAKALGFKIAFQCPCEPKLILLEDTLKRVDLNPDADIKIPINNNGGIGSGVSRNYELPPLQLSKPELNRIDTLIQTKANQMQNTIIISIIDSGVDAGLSFSNDHLFQNVSTADFCGSGRPEGIHGIDIVKATDKTVPPPLDPKDLSGHGTLINGIIGGNASIDKTTISTWSSFWGYDNQIAIKQLNAKNVGGAANNGTLFHALCSIHYSLQKGAKVINASWRVATRGTAMSEMQAFVPTMTALQNADALLVTSSGNDRIDFDKLPRDTMAWPASFSRPQLLVSGVPVDYSDNVITVGAWDVVPKAIPNFSNSGKSIVDIYAPGVDIVSFGLGGSGFVSGQGTSFAAPFVTRTAAVMRGVKPKTKSALTAAEVKRLMISGADLKVPTNSTTGQSVPLLNHNESVKKAKDF